jgi:hypothetical protein
LVLEQPAFVELTTLPALAVPPSVAAHSAQLSVATMPEELAAE